MELLPWLFASLEVRKKKLTWDKSHFVVTLGTFIGDKTKDEK